MGRKEKVLSGSIDMIQVAKWFYYDGLSKTEIASRLSRGRNIAIDPRTVSAILHRAIETGLVQILIQQTPGHSPIESQLRKAYPHLKKVLVLARTGLITSREDYVDMLKQFARKAADYLEEFMRERGDQESLTVAVGGGETVTEMISAVREQSRPNVRIRVPTLVGHGFLGPKYTHLSPSHNALLLWRRLGNVPGAVGFATTPPLPRELNRLEAHLEELAANPDIAEVLNDMKNIDVVFAGIGAVAPSHSLERFRNSLTMTSLVDHLIKPEELVDTEFVERKAVADFSYQFIDEEGNAVRLKGREDALRFFLSAGYLEGQSSLDFFRNMVEQGKDVVAIAGPHKIEAILGALRGKLFNTFITDEISAQDILQRTQSKVSDS